MSLIGLTAVRQLFYIPWNGWSRSFANNCSFDVRDHSGARPADWWPSTHLRHYGLYLSLPGPCCCGRGIMAGRRSGKEKKYFVAQGCGASCNCLDDCCRVDMVRDKHRGFPKFIHPVRDSHSCSKPGPSSRVRALLNTVVGGRRPSIAWLG